MCSVNDFFVLKRAFEKKMNVSVFSTTKYYIGMLTPLKRIIRFINKKSSVLKTIVPMQHLFRH